MSSVKHPRVGIKPLARITTFAEAYVEPEYMGIGPLPATRALERSGLTFDEIGLVELKEAFASQSLACIRQLGLDPAKVNVNGGALLWVIRSDEREHGWW
jgi:acetyl-CoA acetyltransferase